MPNFCLIKDGVVKNVAVADDQSVFGPEWDYVLQVVGKEGIGWSYDPVNGYTAPPK